MTTVTVDRAEYNAVTTELPIFVSVDVPQDSVVTQGQVGPRGAQGPAGPAGGSAITAEAGANLGGHRVVYLDADGLAQYADNAVMTHGNLVVGITSAATVVGDTASIIRMGELTEPSWSWTLDQPIYLSSTGLLSQTPPTSPASFSLVVAFPITPTKLFVSIREPIFLLGD